MIISPDNNLYDDQGLYVWTPQRAKASWDKSYQELREALRSGLYDRLILMGGIPASGKSTWLKTVGRDPKAIYFDATFTNKFGRAMIMDIVGEEKPDTPVEIVFMNTPKNICMERNETRSPDRKVPPEAYDRMCGALEKEGFPTEEEGFNKVTIIST